MGIKFDKDPLAVEQTITVNYMIGQKIVLTISNSKIAYLERQI